ncbi:MAG: hypothetical protein RXR41_04460 [Candidatus Marsarchaeota archaeon]
MENGKDERKKMEPSNDGFNAIPPRPPGKNQNANQKPNASSEVGVEKFMALSRLSRDDALGIYNAYVRAGGNDLEALAEIVDRVKSYDPFLGVYLARWGPSVLDDEETMEALFNAYAYLKARGAASLPQLPSKPRWKLEELSPEAGVWLSANLKMAETIFRANSQTYSSTIYISQRGLPLHPGRLSSQFQKLGPKAVAALSALEDLAPITYDDLARALMRLHVGFDYAWDETLSRLDTLGVAKDLSKHLKEVYLRAGKTFMGKDFYDWIIELVNADALIYNSERNLLYALIAFRDKIVKQARKKSRRGTCRRALKRSDAKQRKGPPFWKAAHGPALFLLAILIHRYKVLWILIENIPVTLIILGLPLPKLV